MATKRVRTLVLTGYGLNCEEETAAAFSVAGSDVTIGHINDFTTSKKKGASLRDYHILALPGGFSYGDHIGGGKIFAHKLMQSLTGDINDFITSKRPIIGICNGFQILIKAGLLPGLPQGRRPMLSMTTNISAQYENRWVTVTANPTNKSFWLRDINLPLSIPARHGEGRIILRSSYEEALIKKHCLIALQYSDSRGNPTQSYPANPNGSALALAGITNSLGNVLGIMPHPEAAFYKELIPHYLSAQPTTVAYPHPLLRQNDGVGMVFFYNAVRYVEETFLSKKPL
ncbi:phosphoribosylformylglycinamidine synthase [Spirochaetota bacterium]|nr:phosphoribosylformylglycinamidine synthase [Spirochaetota bacterium]